MGPEPCGIQAMHPALITCSSGACVNICHTLSTCNSGACEAWAMPSLHAASELVTHEPHPHYIQFWSLPSILHATIKCSSWVYGAYGMPSLSAISELVIHMLCPQLLICNTLCCSVLLCTLSLIGPKGPEPWGLQDMYHAFITCSSGASAYMCHTLLTCSSGACTAYALPPLHAILECVGHMPCSH